MPGGGCPLCVGTGMLGMWCQWWSGSVGPQKSHRDGGGGKGRKKGVHEHSFHAHSAELWMLGASRAQLATCLLSPGPRACAWTHCWGSPTPQNAVVLPQKHSSCRGRLQCRSLPSQNERLSCSPPPAHPLAACRAVRAGGAGFRGVVVSPRGWAGALCLVTDLWQFLSFISHPVTSNWSG